MPPVLSRQMVEEGAWFRRGIGSMTEFAYVIRVHQDRMGIPHVHYHLQVQRPGATPSVEQRTLALESFRSRFQERVRG